MAITAGGHHDRRAPIDDGDVASVEARAVGTAAAVEREREQERERGPEPEPEREPEEAATDGSSGAQVGFRMFTKLSISMKF